MGAKGTNELKQKFGIDVLEETKNSKLERLSREKDNLNKIAEEKRNSVEDAKGLLE